MRLSPRDRNVGAFASVAVAVTHFMDGNYSEAVNWARKAIDHSPEWVAGHLLLIEGLAMDGKMDDAAEARDALLRLRPEFTLAWMADNLPQRGEIAERMREGLRRAGVPEN